MIVLTLPHPPSANHLWIRAKRGMRKSSAYVTWLMLAAIEARKQNPGRLTGRYRLSIDAPRPDARRRDIDNLIKPINDLLRSIGIVRDDSDCDLVSARWVTTGAGVTVRIEPAGAE